MIRSSLSGEHHDYTRGNLFRAVVLLAIPMVLELSMESLFAMCDIFWVARAGEGCDGGGRAHGVDSDTLLCGGDRDFDVGDCFGCPEDRRKRSCWSG